MQNPLTRFIAEMKLKKHYKELKEHNHALHKEMLQGEMTGKEADYIRAVVVQALKQQSEIQETGTKVSELGSITDFHNKLKAESPKAINGLDTFGLVTEALGTIKNKSDFYEEIRDHGIGYAETRIIADMVTERQFNKLDEQEELHGT